MARRYKLKTAGGSTVIPVGVDGSAFTDNIDYGYGSLYELYVEFFSDPDGKIPANPTGGLVRLKATPMGNNYLEAGSGQFIRAQDVTTPDSLYEPIILDGLVQKARVDFSGVTGATYMRAVLFARDGD